MTTRCMVSIAVFLRHCPRLCRRLPHHQVSAERRGPSVESRRRRCQRSESAKCWTRRPRRAAAAARLMRALDPSRGLEGGRKRELLLRLKGEASSRMMRFRSRRRRSLVSSSRRGFPQMPRPRRRMALAMLLLLLLLLFLLLSLLLLPRSHQPRSARGTKKQRT